MVYPADVPSGPPANADMPPDIARDYEEARSIARQSPRGAAALLRLAIQKLCKELGASGDNINSDIAVLVRKGLPDGVQAALDAVRVIGNDAVHPGELDLRDDPETVEALFSIVNFIVEKTISDPKAVQDIYGLLPASKRAAIQKRDGTT